MNILFTSESVSEGHPDKVCDAISDALLDLFLSHEKTSRTAIETMATTNRVILAGETACPVVISPEQISETVRQTIKNIGYEQNGFNWKTVQIENYLHCQSADIALGVDRDGAGDQGIMFGYAKNEKGFNNHYMPAAISLAHQILQKLSNYRHQKVFEGLEPDAKSQVTVRYENGTAVGIDKIVVSTQHKEHLSQEAIRSIIKKALSEVLPNNWMPDDKNILINPTGRFVIGGPEGDTGLTGRKIIVDTYGGYAPHGGGAFSGKDATKVDRSAAYMMRYLAKNIVAAGLADECLLQISYAIGVADPLSFYINTNNTAKVEENAILNTLRQMVDLTPKGIIKHLALQQPIYSPTAAYGHFGHQAEDNGFFSWEKLDLIKDLKNAFNCR